MSQPSSTLAIPEFDNLNPNSAWEWLLTFIGCYIPALSEVSKIITSKAFSNLPRRVRKVFFRSDILPHRIHNINSFDPDYQTVINHVSNTWDLRASAIRDIHSVFPDSKYNQVKITLLKDF
ncbi:hypothetical protein DFH28DRAFT_931623 [Melampsora americana]|nr:hypothetical protein DFH28DRAFT_931623 [Melampsora americana]